MKQWEFYTSKEIKPLGWMEDQLKLQASGLNGNLDKVWRDVRDSAWVGGTAEGWERVPYWLDGFVPLAYLLGDKDMISRAKKYINAIIESQKPDGWICPCNDEDRKSYDTWAVLLISKVLTVYYECSADERIPKVVYKILKNYHTLLKNGEIALFEWGKYRWFEGFIAIEFLKKHYDEEWITDLAKILKLQGMDYFTLTDKWVRPLNKWEFFTHVVNLAMMIKQEAVSCDILGEEYKDNASKLLDILEKHNAMPIGIFTGDECLSGISPIQGVELCAVVEMMYSCEHLFAYSGDKKWLSRLELLAFNALPAAISDDMWSHQYDQSTNQIACVRFPSKSIFTTNHNDAHLFGLEPEFGCCTANFGQGWPKLLLSAFMHKDNRIISAVPVPSRLCDNGINITLKTDYPFKTNFEYVIDSDRNFEFVISVPSFAKNIKLDGEIVGQGDIRLDIKAGKRVINLSYETESRFEKSPVGLNIAKKGSLIFAIPIEYDKVMLEYVRDGVERKFPYCDYELYGKSDWEFAYCGTKLDAMEKEVDQIPFSSQKPAIVLKTEVVPINWGLLERYEHVCAKLPESLTPVGEKREIILYPYGCAKLRMTEVPFAPEGASLSPEKHLFGRKPRGGVL